MKRFACHGSAQIPLQVLENLRAEHEFSAADVDSVLVCGNEDMLDRHNIRRPSDPMLAQYSVPFCVALSFFRDPRDPGSFDDNALNDPRILAFIDKIRLDRDPLGSHGVRAASVVVRLKDGRVLSDRLETFKGNPDLPPSRDDVREKFMLLTRSCPEARMGEIFDRLQAIEREKTLDWLKM
jgi:2-methylcitrate dehydratase PrpD